MKHYFFRRISLILVVSMLVPLFGMAEGLPVYNEPDNSAESAILMANEATYDLDNVDEVLANDDVEDLALADSIPSEELLTLEDIDLTPEGGADVGEVSSGQDEGPREIEMEDNPNQEEDAAEEDVLDKNAIPSKLKLGVGEKYTLKYKNATFKSSKRSIASVDNKGVISAKKVGAATITVKADGKKVATCKVTVRRAPTSLKLDVTKLKLSVGKTKQMKATLSKNSASKITWTSNKKKVATVDGKGVITAVGKGKARITAKTFNGLKATVTVTVDTNPWSLSFEKKSLSIGLKENITLKPIVNEGAKATFTWKSKNPKIVKVTPKGRITGLKKGTTTITVTTQNKLKATLKVKVLAAPDKVTIKAKGTLNVGKTLQLKAKLPKRTASRITWTSSKPKIAKVDKNGLVTGRKAGTAIITAKTFNGKTATCEVTVKENTDPKELELPLTSLNLTVGDTYTVTPRVNEGAIAQFTWKSADEKVATVSAEGVITAVGAGKTEITVSTQNGLTASLALTVEEVLDVLTISGNQEKVVIGDSWQLTATMLPSGKVPQVTWTSSNADVATVSAEGLVFAVGLGMVSITATTSDGESYSVETRVMPASDGDFEMSDGVITGYKGSGGSITLPQTDYQGNVIVGIADSVFEGNQTIQSVALCETLLSIGARAFKDCSSLTELYIPGSVESIGSEAFDATLKLVCTLDSYAYYYARNMGQPVQLLGNYDVADVEKEGNSVNALVVSTTNCTLMMEVWDDSESNRLGSMSLMVAGSDDPQTVSFDLTQIGDMPDYFVLKLYFRDDYGDTVGNPLVCMDYTAAFSEFRSKKREDFEGSRIVEDEDGGFAVLNDAVSEVPGSVEGDGFRVASMEEVQSGDVLFITTLNTFVKVGSVTENDDGTYSVSMADEAHITDFYKYVRYDTTFDVVDSLETNGRINRNQVVSNKVFSYGGSAGGKVYEKEVSIEGSQGLKVTGKASMSAKVSFDLYVDAELFGDKYISSKAYIDIDGETSLGLSKTAEAYAGKKGKDIWGEARRTIQLYKGDIPTPLAGVFIVADLTVPLKIGAEASATLTVPFDAKMGFRVQTGDGVHGIKESHVGAPSLKAEGKVTVSAGIAVEIGVAATPARIVKASIIGEGGVRIVASTTFVEIEAGFEPESKHGCQLCLDLAVEGYLETNVKFVIELLGHEYNLLANGTIGGSSLPLPKKTWPILKGYLSLINSKDSIHGGKVVLGKGECPNHSYRVRVSTKNANGETYTGEAVTIYKVDSNTGAENQVDFGKSQFATYLYKGAYKARARINGVAVEKTFTVDKSAKDVVLMPDGKGWIKGRVTDAADGVGIPGATVSCEDASTTTDQYGAYTLEVPADTIHLTFSAEEYISKEMDVTVEPMQTLEDVNVSLTKKVEGAVRVVLTWGETPADLDSHLTWSGGHVYYQNMQQGEAMLDVDDTTSYGPETVTFTPQPGVAYTYYVHDYTNRENPSSSEMGASGAKVDIYLPDGSHTTRNVPGGRGINWVVFTYKDGAISYGGVASNSISREIEKLPEKLY